MKCPSCNENITIGNVDRCEYCGFMAPGARHFANGESFSKWKCQEIKKESKQDEPLPADSTNTENTPDTIREEKTKTEPSPEVFNTLVTPKTTNEASVTNPATDPASKSNAKTLAFIISACIASWYLYTILTQLQYSDLYSYVLPNIFHFGVWITLLIAFVNRKRKTIMFAGLLLLSVSHMFEYFWFSYELNISVLLSTRGVFYMLEVFIPALLLLIKFKKKTAKFKYLPGGYFVFCFIANIFVMKFPFVQNIIDFLFTIFFFSAGNYFHLLNGNDSSDKKKKDDMSVHNEPDVETLK